MTSQKIKFLTVSQVLFINDQMVKRFGGSFGVRDLGLVESAVARSQASFDGEYLYTNIYDMVAALLQSLLKNHPFIDGNERSSSSNKRTALTSTGIFLELNDHELKNYHQEEVEFAVQVDNQNLSLEEIAKWLRAHSQEI
jgi:death on curing protein